MLTRHSRVPFYHLLLLLWLSASAQVPGAVQLMTLEDLLTHSKNQSPTPSPSSPSPPSSPLSSDTLTTLFSQTQTSNSQAESFPHLPKIQPSVLDQLFSSARAPYTDPGSPLGDVVDSGPQTSGTVSKTFPSSTPPPTGSLDLSSFPTDLAAQLAKSMKKGGQSGPIIIILPQSKPPSSPSPPLAKEALQESSPSLPMSSSLLEVLNQLTEPALPSGSGSVSNSVTSPSSRPDLHSNLMTMHDKPATDTHTQRQTPSNTVTQVESQQQHAYVPARTPPYTHTYHRTGSNSQAYPQTVPKPQTYHHTATKPRTYTHTHSQSQTQPHTYRYTYPRSQTQTTSQRQTYSRPQPQPQHTQSRTPSHHSPAYRNTYIRPPTHQSRQSAPPPKHRPTTQSFNNHVRRKAPINFVPPEWNSPRATRTQPSQTQPRAYSVHHSYSRPFPTTASRGQGPAEMVMGPAYNEMVMGQAARFGDMTYYRQHGCVDPSSVLSDMPPSHSLTFTCSAPHADMVCERVAIQMGAPVGLMSKVFSRMNPAMSRLAEKCLTPDRMEQLVRKVLTSKGQATATATATPSTTTNNNHHRHHSHYPAPQNQGTQGTISYRRGKRQASRHQPHHHPSRTPTSSQGQVDCSPLMPLIMANLMAPGEGLMALLTPEGVADLRKQFLAYSCQDFRVSYTRMPFRMCCPGRVEPPTRMDLANALKSQSMA